MSKETDKKNIPSSPPFSNNQWIDLLSPPPNEQAVDELRRILVRGLKPALAKYVDRELDQFVQDVAQDGLLRILENIDSFRGESKFTTWAMKIAVREGLGELRRVRWKNISIEDLKGDDQEEGREEIFSSTMAGEEAGPDETTDQKMILEQVKRLIEELLTDRQRKAFQALVVQNMPISIVAEKMNTNRNNLYKLVHDARQKLKDELEVQGINPEEMLDQLSTS